MFTFSKQSLNWKSPFLSEFISKAMNQELREPAAKIQQAFPPRQSLEDFLSAPIDPSCNLSLPHFQNSLKDKKVSTINYNF